MPTASPWIRQGAFPSCTPAPSKHSAVLSSLEQMGPIKVLVSSTTSAKYPSTGTKSGEKNKPRRGSLLTVLKMQSEVCWGADLAPHPTLGAAMGPEMLPHTLRARTSALCLGNHSSQSSARHFCFPFFGNPVLIFLFFFLNQAVHAQTEMPFTSCLQVALLEWEKGNFISLERKQRSARTFFSPFFFFFPKMFSTEIGLRHRCPYSAACSLRKTLLSSALQMRVEIFPKRGEFLSDLPLFQLHLWSLVPR